MIGGEFPITINDVQNTEVSHHDIVSVYAYSSGRAALYQILLFLSKEKGVKNILLPDYLCSSILIPINALGLDFSFYPIDELLQLNQPSFERLYKKDTAVLLINYFGLKDLCDQIKIIKGLDNKAIIIEDDVQAYFEFVKPLKEVDFKFTSLRKTFAVPDGGLVKTHYMMSVVKSQNTFGQYKLAAALLKSMREYGLNDEVYLELFEKGESLINSDLNFGMSRMAERLYAQIDENKVKESRVNNAFYLLKELNKKGIYSILPLSKDHVPLFVPVALKDRDAVRRELFQHDIYCPVHWPLNGMELIRGKAMAEMELSLIIDQRYGLRDMDKIIKCF